jgi:hypothetical protein
MTSGTFTESVVEQAALAWLESLGYAVLAGPEIAPGEPQAERGDYRQVVLERRLRQALERLNPQFSSDVLEEAYRKLTRPESPSLVANNRTVHKYLVEGVTVEFTRPDGSMGSDAARLEEGLQRIAHALMIGPVAADQQGLHEVAPRLVAGPHDLDDIVGGNVQLVVHLDQIADFPVAMDKIAMAELRQPGMPCACLFEPWFGIGTEGAFLAPTEPVLEFPDLPVLPPIYQDPIIPGAFVEPAGPPEEQQP